MRGSGVKKVQVGERENSSLRRDSSKFENAEAHSVYNSTRAARRRKTKWGVFPSDARRESLSCSNRLKYLLE